MLYTYLIRYSVSSGFLRVRLVRFLAFRKNSYRRFVWHGQQQSSQGLDIFYQPQNKKKRGFPRFFLLLFQTKQSFDDFRHFHVFIGLRRQPPFFGSIHIPLNRISHVFDFFNPCFHLVFLSGVDRLFLHDSLTVINHYFQIFVM